MYGTLGVLYEVKRKERHMWRPRSWRSISGYTACRIFMKFGSAVLYRNLSRNWEFHENRLSYFSYGHQCVAVRSFPIYRPMWITFRTRDLSLMLLGIYKLRQNRCNESETLLKGANDILSVFSTSPFNSDKIRYRKSTRNDFGHLWFFVKIEDPTLVRCVNVAVSVFFTLIIRFHQN